MMEELCRVTLRLPTGSYLFEGYVGEDGCYLQLMEAHGTKQNSHVAAKITFEPRFPLPQKQGYLALLYPEGPEYTTSAKYNIQPEAEVEFIDCASLAYPLMLLIWPLDKTMDENRCFSLHLMWDTLTQQKFKAARVTTRSTPRLEDLELEDQDHALIEITSCVWDIVVPAECYGQLLQMVEKSTDCTMDNGLLNLVTETATAYQRELKTSSRNFDLGHWLTIQSHRNLRNRLIEDHKNTTLNPLARFNSDLKISTVKTSLREVYQELRQKPSAYASAMATPIHVWSTESVEIEEILVRIYTPAELQEGRCLIYLHGGGFILGDEQSDYGNLTRICEGAKSVVVSVGYHLAPENPFPAAVHSVKAVLKWFREWGRDRYGIDPRNIAMLGVSAGATIAAITAFEDAATVSEFPLKFHALWAPMVKLNAVPEEASRLGNFSGLTSSKAFEYQSLAIPQNCEWQDILFPSKLLTERKMSPTLAYSPQDCCLRNEFQMYVQHLRQAGQIVELRAFPGIPHHGLDVAGISPANEILGQVIRDMEYAFHRRSWA